MSTSIYICVFLNEFHNCLAVPVNLTSLREDYTSHVKEKPPHEKMQVEISS